MKKITLFVFCLLSLIACDKDQDLSEMREVQVAVPETMPLADFRAMVSVEEASAIEESGKIYTYQNLIFINDNLKGVHIIDNSNPENPVKKAFIRIPQNTDVAVKDDLLYANSGIDLVVFDISDINNIQLQNTIENVFEVTYLPIPAEADYADYENVDFSEEVVVGYSLKTDYIEVQTDIMVNESADFASGTGGSLARFNIVKGYLYTVTQTEMHIFDIVNPENAVEVNSENVGWDIETIFSLDNYLYLGSAGGMYIYNIDNATNPTYVSEINHIMGCDPVVVQGDMAYVTIRGGNSCGQNLSQLEVIDISDKTNPFRANIYEMQEPYGLGVKGDFLFVCDGSFGLKVYDTTNTPQLTLIDHFENIETFDVIPLEEVLLMVGGNRLFQYKYSETGIELLSTFNMN
ncbi:MAG: LVIVD repeat-containing protein [Mesonia sp.]|uniref:LVIVD repeat-containing protein n=1 Tax=Mesonia sp. TaxID=1960830 RepID=UPI003F981D94